MVANYPIFLGLEAALLYRDDPIVEYIPKEYFMQAGERMYIGDDYGYYIYTFPDGIFDGALRWHARAVERRQKNGHAF